MISDLAVLTFWNYHNKQCGWICRTFGTSMRIVVVAVSHAKLWSGWAAKRSSQYSSTASLIITVYGNLNFRTHNPRAPHVNLIFINLLFVASGPVAEDQLLLFSHLKYIVCSNKWSVLIKSS